jgi:hypothetical protein
MALEIETYFSNIDDNIIEPWLSRLLDLGMRCELHPDFSFKTQSGYLPIKLRNLRPTREEFKGKDFLSGFEFYLDEFNIVSIPFQRVEPRKGLSSFFVKRPSLATFRISPDIDQKLETCKFKLTFRFSPADVFELRLADLSSIIIAELTNGIRYLPSDGEWMTNIDFAQTSLESIEEFERSLSEGGYQSHLFEGWIG